jgi:hypothetical protein
MQFISVSNKKSFKVMFGTIKIDIKEAVLDQLEPHLFNNLKSFKVMPISWNRLRYKSSQSIIVSDVIESSGWTI